MKTREDSCTEGSGIAVLVVDEAIALGGVERLWVGLAPELARLTSRFVWMLPAHRIATIRGAIPNGASITFEALHSTNGWLDKLLAASLRRAARRFKRTSQEVENWLMNRRIRSICRRFNITHVLYPALFVQRFPSVHLPVYAAVMDTNYHPAWRKACEANLAYWAERAQCLISISSFTLTEMQRRVGAHSGARLRAIPIAVEKPSSVEARASRRVGDGATVYYPGSFNPHKGHAILLKALRSLHEDCVYVQTVMTGGGLEQLTGQERLQIPELEDARLELTSAPEAFRRSVHVRGLVSVQEVEECYQQADFIVLPSQYEGFGLPLAEAIGRGKRVLCTDIPAFREQVQLYGFEAAVTFVAEGGPNAWAAAIRSAINERSAFPYSQHQLSALFERRTWKTVADEYLTELNQT